MSGRWSWLLVPGLMDILIAFLIIAGLPGSAEWAIGLLVGINHVVRRRHADRHGVGGAQQLSRKKSRCCRRFAG